MCLLLSYYLSVIIFTNGEVESSLYIRLKKPTSAVTDAIASLSASISITLYSMCLSKLVTTPILRFSQTEKQKLI